METNLALACRSCNLHKADHVNGYDELTQSFVLLFNPRQDHWQEHFRMATQTGALEGLTEIGRARVASVKQPAANKTAA